MTAAVLPFRSPARDRITILRCAGSLVLTKIHTPCGDEGDKPPRAKWFTPESGEVGNLTELYRLLDRLRAERNACILRGQFVGAEHAAAMPEVGGEAVYCASTKRVRRLSDLFRDEPAHWLAMDIDGWNGSSVDPVEDPVTAIGEWIDTHLPAPFHDVSVVWQLSASAGIKPGLHAHLWYWLATPATCAQLKAWATANGGLDVSMYERARIHYTADPLFEGREDPITTRLGWLEGLFSDEVSIDLGHHLEVVTEADDSGGDTHDDLESTVAGLENLKPPVGLSIEKARELVMATPREEVETYHGWLEVGMALHHEFDGNDAALELFDEFSAVRTPEHYDRAELEEKWRSFGRSTGVTKTMRSLMKRQCRGFEEISEEINSLSTETDAATVTRFAAEAAELPAVERDKLHTALASRTGVKLSVVREAAKEARQRLADDHLAYALKVVEAEGRDNLLSTAGAVWRWESSGVWARLGDRTVRQMVQRALPRWSRVIAKSMVDSVTDLLRTEVHIEGHRFDVGDPETINCRNGELVHTANGWRLEEHRREHYRTSQIPVAYDPEARAPRFERFLGEVFEGDPDADDKARAILEMVGYSLVAHCRFERFALLVGAGANGKSVLLRVLSALVGADRVAGVQPSKFGSPFQRGHLEGKLVNLVSETRMGEVIDDAALKAIVSGEASTVEHKNRDPFELRPYATCWFGTNHTPTTRDVSDGFFRRALVIEFNRRFRAEDGTADTNLAGKLETELPGILALAVGAYGEALARGHMTTPASSRKAAARWRREADQAAQFVEEACTEEPEAATPIRELYAAYREWALASGHRNLFTANMLSRRLDALGFARRKGGGGVRVVAGLAVRESGDGFEVQH